MRSVKRIAIVVAMIACLAFGATGVSHACVGSSGTCPCPSPHCG